MKTKRGKTIINPIYTYIFSILLVFCISCSEKDILEQKKVASPDENNWIFLMAGQSNMAGRGNIEMQDLVTNDRILSIDSSDNWIVAKEPLHFYEPNSAALDCGVSFARELLKHVDDSVIIAMVPCAVGGSSVFEWQNNEEHRGVRLLSNFQQKVQLSKAKGVIKGILWHQGERNANATDLPTYKEALIDLFGKFKSSVNDNNLPIIMGELGSFAQPEEKVVYFEKVNEIVRTIAAENNNLYYVSSEGLNHKGDNLHFNSEAQRELGKRYAQKMLEVQSNK